MSAMIDDANQLALTIGLSPADGKTFGKEIRSINGQNYAIATCSRCAFLHLPQLIEPGTGQRALGWLMGEGWLMGGWPLRGRPNIGKDRITVAQKLKPPYAVCNRTALKMRGSPRGLGE